jgi:hypothetical protein
MPLELACFQLAQRSMFRGLQCCCSGWNRLNARVVDHEGHLALTLAVFGTAGGSFLAWPRPNSLCEAGGVAGEVMLAS